MKELINQLDVTHWILLFTTIISGSFGIWQFILKRKYERLDKNAERRYQAYKSFMKTSEEIGKKSRISLNDVLDLTNSNISILLSQNEEESQKTLTEFNAKLYDYVKKSFEPLEIIKSELYEMKLLSSKKLLAKLKELEEIIEFISNETTKDLHMITTDPNEYNNKMQSLVKSERVIRLQGLFEEILERMRIEINIRD